MKSLRRFLVTEGRIGEVPTWYTLISAARYLKVAPWELAEKPVWWVNTALAAQAAEADAQKQRSERKGKPSAHGG